MIELLNVSKTYQDGVMTTAVSDVSLTLGKREFIALVGPSGCGKSTLLRIIASLIEPSDGTIRYHNDATTDNLRFGYVFQDPALLPWLSARDNVAMPSRISGEPALPPETILRQVGLSGFERHLPAQLSGGMQQRVALARALSTQPNVLCMDEPFAAVDDLTRFDLNDQVMSLWSDTEMSAALVTHNIEEAVFLATKVIVLTPSPARVVAQIDVPFDYPRHSTLRSNREFQSLVQCVHKHLSIS